jgi:hypothetical protein
MLTVTDHVFSAYLRYKILIMQHSPGVEQIGSYDGHEVRA